MAKLHELLAVAASKVGQATKVVTDLTATFSSKNHLFTETRKVFTANTEGSVPQTEEELKLNSTVGHELKRAGGFIADMIDVGHMINLANTIARADVTLEDGKVIATNLPATTLLELEKHLAVLKGLISVTPTLDPAKGFEKDTTKGPDVYKARPVTKTRTAKQKRVITLCPPTDKHPAQVQLVDEDVTTGIINQDEWSGMLTPAEKAEKLDRVEKLLRAVKAARSRANEVKVDYVKIGFAFVDYVL